MFKTIIYILILLAVKQLVYCQEDCLPGYFGFNECLPCPIGTYNEESGKLFEADCLPCSPGYSSEVGSPDCFPCPPIESINQQNIALDLCYHSNCLEGEFMNVENKTCRLCPPYAIRSLVDPVYQCTPCGDNQESNIDRTICISCSQATYRVENDTHKCLSCNTGYIHNTITGECVSCSIGYISFNDTCEMCPYGTSSSNNNCVESSCSIDDARPWCIPSGPYVELKDINYSFKILITIICIICLIMIVWLIYGLYEDLNYHRGNFDTCQIASRGWSSFGNYPLVFILLLIGIILISVNGVQRPCQIDLHEWTYENNTFNANITIENYITGYSCNISRQLGIYWDDPRYIHITNIINTHTEQVDYNRCYLGIRDIFAGFSPECSLNNQGFYNFYSPESKIGFALLIIGIANLLINIIINLFEVVKSCFKCCGESCKSKRSKSNTCNRFCTFFDGIGDKFKKMADSFASKFNCLNEIPICCYNILYPCCHSKKKVIKEKKVTPVYPSCPSCPSFPQTVDSSPLNSSTIYPPPPYNIYQPASLDQNIVMVPLPASVLNDKFYKYISQQSEV